MLEFLFSKAKPQKSFINSIENVQRMDLNRMLTGGLIAPILLKVSGEDEAFGISDGDFVMIDRARTAKTSDIVLRFSGDSPCFEPYEPEKRRGLYLVPKNPPPIIVKDEIYGVVTFVIKQLK